MRSWCSRAVHAIGVVKALTEREQPLEQQQEAAALWREVEAMIVSSRSHPQVDTGYAEQIESRCLRGSSMHALERELAVGLETRWSELVRHGLR